MGYVIILSIFSTINLGVTKVVQLDILFFPHPMLSQLHSLFKLAQLHGVFVCDFIHYYKLWV